MTSQLNTATECAQDMARLTEPKEVVKQAKQTLWTQKFAILFNVVPRKSFFLLKNIRIKLPTNGTQCVTSSSSTILQTQQLTTRSILPFNHNNDTRVIRPHHGNITRIDIVAGQPTTHTYYQQLIDGNWVPCVRTAHGSGPKAHITVKCDSERAEALATLAQSREDHVKSIIAAAHADGIAIANEETSTATGGRVSILNWRPHHGPKPPPLPAKNLTMVIGGDARVLPRTIAGGEYAIHNEALLVVFLSVLLATVIYSVCRYIRVRLGHRVAANNAICLEDMQSVEPFSDPDGDEEKNIGFVDTTEDDGTEW